MHNWQVKNQVVTHVFPLSNIDFSDIHPCKMEMINCQTIIFFYFVVPNKRIAAPIRLPEMLLLRDIIFRLNYYLVCPINKLFNLGIKFRCIHYYSKLEDLSLEIFLQWFKLKVDNYYGSPSFKD